MIEPFVCLSTGMKASVVLKVPCTFTSMVFFQLAAAFGLLVVSRMMMPALFTSRSTWPTSCATRAASAWQASGAVTSSTNDQASPPSLRTSCAVSATVASFMSVTTTRAPAWARPSASARPLPWPAPVISARRPSSRRGAT
ncbi:hypothetical protein D9M69_519000 [compost metagenome]